jgi:hypothetical protein
VGNALWQLRQDDLLLLSPRRRQVANTGSDRDQRNRLRPWVFDMKSYTVAQVMALLELKARTRGRGGRSSDGHGGEVGQRPRHALVVALLSSSAALGCSTSVVGHAAWRIKYWGVGWAGASPTSSPAPRRNGLPSCAGHRQLQLSIHRSWWTTSAPFLGVLHDLDARRLLAD